jgi:hypothetical protein
MSLQAYGWITRWHRVALLDIEQSIEVNTYDMGEDNGHTVTEVRITFPVLHKHLESAQEQIK